MFEVLSEYQRRQLETVWKAALNAVHWRDRLRYEISRALASGCTLEHLAAVTASTTTQSNSCDGNPAATSTAGTHRPPSARPGEVLRVSQVR
jgi:hypothetical protein